MKKKNDPATKIRKLKEKKKRKKRHTAYIWIEMRIDP